MQLVLDLPAATPKLGHGGARPGAGRPARKRKPGDPLPHVARPKVDRYKPMHVTLRIVRGVPSLEKELLRNRVRRALFAARRKSEEKGAEFQIVHFKIEGNHLHLVVEGRSGLGVSRGMAGMQIRIARAVNRALGRRGNVFADRYHRRDLGTPTEVRNVLVYVLNNARKHTRHIGHVAYVDVTSSGESFDGWNEEVTMYRSLGDDTEPWTLVKPWTWLARTGWRRRGLISPFAVPSAKPSTY